MSALVVKAVSTRISQSSKCFIDCTSKNEEAFIVEFGVLIEANVNY